MTNHRNRIQLEFGIQAQSSSLTTSWGLMSKYPPQKLRWVLGWWKGGTTSSTAGEHKHRHLIGGGVA